MDLGATLCTRTKPSCETCPVHVDCKARQQEAIAQYPGRKPKRKKPLRTTTMVLANIDDAVYLERRPEAGIWGGLWSLPELGEQCLDDWVDKALGDSIYHAEKWNVLRHSFSHYDLDIQPIVVRSATFASKVADSGATTWYKLSEAPPGGIAAPVKLLLDLLENEQVKKREDVTHG